MITTWYLHSHRTWDRLCHSCISSSFLPHGAFPEVGAYAISSGLHAGSLEALRVTRPEAVDLEGINLVNNYWATTDPTAIGKLILDHLDDPTRPTVDFQPLWS